MQLYSGPERGCRFGFLGKKTTKIPKDSFGLCNNFADILTSLNNVINSPGGMLQREKERNTSGSFLFA